MIALLKNERFWLAVLALVQTVALKYLGVPSDIWLAIDGIIVVVIGSLTVDKVSERILSMWREHLELTRSLAKK